MADEILSRDQNHVTVLGGITDDSNQYVTMLRVDPTTKRLLVSATGIGAGTVTSVSVVSANGFAGTVATATTTPAITLSTTITGILQGNGTAISAITVGSGLSFVAGTLSATGGSGTVTSVSVTTANGVSGSVATATTTPAITITLGAITPTTVNGLTITANGTNTLNITAGKTLAVTQTLTLSGTDSTVMTFPSTSASIARIDAGQTFTGVQVMTSPSLTSPKIVTNIVDTNGNELFVLTATASAVNEITLANGATGNNPKLTASGDDANIGFDFQAKGTGTYRLLGTADQAAELRLYEDTTDGTNYTAFKVGTQAADITYTLPTDDGDAGQVLSTNGSGVLDWIAAGGAGAWTLKSYSTATAASITVSSLNLSTDNKHYRMIIEMDNDTVDERVNPYIQINASTTADTYGTVWSGRVMDWSAGTASDSNGVFKGSQWKLGSAACYSQYYTIDFFLAESEASAARVTGTFHSVGNGNDTLQEDFTSYVGTMFNNDQTNITSIKLFTDGAENKDWRVWVLYPAIA